MIKSIKRVESLEQDTLSTQKLSELLTQDTLNRMLQIARNRKDKDGEATQQ